MAKKCVLWAITAAMLLGPRAVLASTITITDGADDKITITCGGWGVSFTVVQGNLNKSLNCVGKDNQGMDIKDSITLEESGAGVAFTGTEKGTFTAKAANVYFSEPGTKTISDILTYNYSGSTLTGSFNSDTDETNGLGMLPAPAGSTTYDESKGPFDFSNGSTVTATAESDKESAPEPTTVVLLLAGLLLSSAAIRR